MRAADAVVLAQDLVSAIEAEARAAPDDATRAQLAAEHDEAWEILERAEHAAAANWVWRRPTPAALWEEWLTVRFVSRRCLSAGRRRRCSGSSAESCIKRCRHEEGASVMPTLAEMQQAAANLLDVLEEQERAAEFEQRVADEVERRLAERAARDEAAQINGLRRSRMSAAEKSRIIRSKGKEFYDRIPWE